MDIQWYPGHMTKARRAMQEDIRLIDLLIEILDARVPMASRNPDIDQLGQGKYRLIVLNKADLADAAATEAWLAYFRERGAYAAALDARGSVRQVDSLIAKVVAEKKERDKKRGILNRPVRVMVAGIPNVGKSTFINSFAGRSAAKTGNKPGVTRGNQWIRVRRDLELLDTPGILWPRFDDKTVGVRLALIGSVKDDILDSENLALEGIGLLQKRGPQALEERYGFAPEGAPEKILAEIGRLRGCLVRGGEVDLEKAGRVFLEDLRSGRLGRLSLETAAEA